MIQLKCPRCGEGVAFSASDRIATCPGCQYAVQVHTGNKAPPQEPNKDRDITNAMLICLAIVVISFGIPIVAGLLGKGPAKLCQIESPQPASVYEEDELLGQTPLRIPRAAGDRSVMVKAEGFSESQLMIPATDSEPAECKLSVQLQAK